MANFSWKTDKAAKGLVLLKLQGEMTLGAREAMREAFESLVSASESVAAVDFTDVKLVSSGAIGELVRCQSRLSAGRLSSSWIATRLSPRMVSTAGSTCSGRISE